MSEVRLPGRDHEDAGQEPPPRPAQLQCLPQPFLSDDRHGLRAQPYRRGEVHTNTVEANYSIFKRGMKGVYQHCSERHLQRHLAEFDFR